MYGPLVEQEIRIKRSNQEMREIQKYLDLVADIKKRRLGYIGCTLRYVHKSVEEICSDVNRINKNLLLLVVVKNTKNALSVVIQLVQ